MKQIIKYFDRIVLLILSVVGLASCETMAEYGTPNADFQIKGTVTDSVTNTPLKNIRVIRRFVQNPLYGDTIYTDADGKYNMNFNDFPVDNPQFTLKIEDVDGTQNGGEFSDRELITKITSTDWVDDGDDNWYYGKAVKNQDVKLKYKAK